MAAAGPGLCERDRGGAGAVPLHGVGKKQLFSLFGLPLRVPAEELEKYAGGKSLYGWIVGEAEEYETPSPLAEFGLTRPPMSWQYIEIPDDKEE